MRHPPLLLGRRRQPCRTGSPCGTLRRVVVACVSCVAALAASDPLHAAEPQRAPTKVAAQHLPNVVRVNDKVFSGGQPAGAAGFAELQRLGVKTVLSVDGARPDADLAARYGLRYVHLPHGYDGIAAQRIKELAKAVRDLEGPIYIHCHHGKHRSPAAAGAACVALGLNAPEEALRLLETAGTSPRYQGLFAAVRGATPVSPAELDALQVEFRPAVAPPPLVEAMVELEHAHDRLRQIAAAGWRAPADHPDLAPAHEALLLREHFTELQRLADVRRQPAGFLALLRESEAAATALETTLRAWRPADAAAAPPPELDASAGIIAHGCAACHEQYRDQPR